MLSLFESFISTQHPSLNKQQAPIICILICILRVVLPREKLVHQLMWQGEWAQGWTGALKSPSTGTSTSILNSWWFWKMGQILDTYVQQLLIFVPGRIHFLSHWLKSFLFISVSDGSVFAKNAGFQIFLGQPSEFPLLQVSWNLFFALVFIHIWGSPSFPCTWASTWCGSLRESCHHGWHSSK